MAKQKNDTPDRRGSIQKLFDRLALSWRLMVDQRVAIPHKIIPILAVLYVLSPIDLMPELVFGPFGVIDDIGVAIMALEFFISMAPDGVVREHLNHLKSRYTEARNERGFDTGDVIDGEYKVKNDQQ